MVCTAEAQWHSLAQGTRWCSAPPALLKRPPIGGPREYPTSNRRPSKMAKRCKIRPGGATVDPILHLHNTGEWWHRFIAHVCGGAGISEPTEIPQTEETAE